MTEIIKFDHVTKRYGDKIVIDNLNFSIKTGEFITILGTSGSGKTTTLKMINRLIEPSSGAVIFDGSQIDQLDEITLRRRIGYVVQQIGLFPHQIVEENIAIVPKLLNWDKKTIKARVSELLSLIKLPYDQYAKRYPNELSGGQQQRVGVARALAADPSVTLFDEPFGAIDAITRSELQEELLTIHKTYPNKTFVFITHDIYEAFKLGTRVMIMDEGKIAQFDTPEAILKKPANDFVKRLLDTAKNQESYGGRNMFDVFRNYYDEFLSALLEHIEISFIAIVTAIVLAIFVTIFLNFYKEFSHVTIYLFSLMYAIPSFALFALLIPITGLGQTTAIIVLVIYAQYILVRTFLSGLSQVDKHVIEAAKAMGMTKWQILLKVQFPLAQKSFFAGLRLASTAIIAIATIGATINAGGLGVILFDGLRTMNLTKLLWGIILTVGLSLLTNLIICLVEELFQKEYSV